MIEQPALHRGTARYEVRQVEWTTRELRRILAPGFIPGCDAWTILSRELISPGRWLVTYIAFWRTDADPT